MFEIINQSMDFEKKDVYELVRGESKNLNSLADGETVAVIKWLLYDEREKRILTFITADGGHYSGISAMAQDSLIEKWNYCNIDGEPLEVTVQKGRSRNGREFILFV